MGFHPHTPRPAMAKSETIVFRVTETQKAAIQRNAVESGFRSVSEFLILTSVNGERRTAEASILASLSRSIGQLQQTAKKDGWTEDARAELSATAKAIRLALGFRT